MMVAMNADAAAHAKACRALVGRARSATLCTLSREPLGFPYGSLVALAADTAGAPILLLSTMAEHTQNLLVRSESSLLVTAAHGRDDDPLALGRVTLIGRCARMGAAEAVAARSFFLQAHPQAKTYVDFGDFAFYGLRVDAIRYVGGFGSMSWVDFGSYCAAI